MSSDGICVIDSRIPSHFDSNSWISSFRRTIVKKGRHNSLQNRWLQWPRSTRRSSKRSDYLGESDPLFELFVPPDWPFFLRRVLWMIRFSVEAIFASSTSKSGVRIPLTENEDFKSSAESTISTSLIHSISSVWNCEQVHSSVLNLLFQQANVADVVNLSKWGSEICSRCWSAP